MNEYHYDAEEHAGWEIIWRSGDIPPRYRSSAAPNATVVEWSKMIPPGGFVLDVGCGVGRHVIYLGERGFRVAGVDISPSGVRLAQAACTERQIVFDGRVSSMTTLPWPDATFDAALSTAAIHHHLRAGIVQAVAEVRRVLKPGGTFLVDFPCTETITYQTFRAQADDGQMTEVEPNTFIDEEPDFENSDDFLPHHFCDEAEVRDLLQKFEFIDLWPDLQEMKADGRSGMVGKWVAVVRRPPAS